MNSPIFDVKKISLCSYGKTVLNDITFTVNEGEFVTITGPSGGGKSTLLKIIATIFKPSSGEILYKNKPIQEYNPVEYRKEVSYFYQTANLFDNTVQDNLEFPYKIRNKNFDKIRAIEMLEMVGLDKTYLYKSITDLSGGEKQRIAIIRNIQFIPKVLLLDEITSSLDMANQQVIGNLIKKYNQEHNLTIFWVTHNMREIEGATRILNIENNKMEEKINE